MELNDANTTCLQLKGQLADLHEEQSCRGRILSSLIDERNKLLHDISQEAIHYPVDGSLPHYLHILPLVKEIHLLQLKQKEQQKEYDKRKLHCEAARLGHTVLVDSFGEEECVLKQWLGELKELSSKAADTGARKTGSASYSVTNVTYHAVVDKQIFTEDLGFTVLCLGVHVRVLIKSEIPCPNIHLSSVPTTARIGVNSDTYVPKLEENIISAASLRGHISGIVSMVSQHIQEDMAPFVIIIPMKKKAGKSKEIKSKGVKPSDKELVHRQDSEQIQ